MAYTYQEGDPGQWILDRSGAPVGMTDAKGVNCFFGVSTEVAGLSTVNTAAANAAAIQAALDAAHAAGAGKVTLSTPGSYSVGDGPSATADASLFIDDNVMLEIGKGVVLLQATPNKSFLINSKWKSNRVAIASVTYAYDTPSTGIVTTTIVTSAPHGLVAGSAFQVKGDTNYDANGGFTVAALDATLPTTKFTILRYGKNGSNHFNAIAGSPFLFEANKNISVIGEGYIDYIGNGGGGTNLKLMGSIMNKINNLKWTIDVRNAPKYGVYTCNIIHGEYDNKMQKNSSDGIHVSGPSIDLTISATGGETSDDPLAFTCTNLGFTTIDLLDADGQKNSDGDIVDVRIDNLNPRTQHTRSVLFSADSGYSCLGISIRRMCSVLGNNNGPLIALESFDTAYNGSRIDLHVDEIYYVPNSVGNGYLSTNGSGAAVVDLNLSFGTIKVKARKGYTGLKAAGMLFGSIGNKVVIKASSIDADHDTTPVVTHSHISMSGTGAYDVSIGKAHLNTTAGTRTVAFADNTSTGATPTKVAVGSFRGIGGYVCPFRNTLSNAGIFNADRVELDNSGIGGVSLLGAVTGCSAHFGSVKVIGGGSNGMVDMATATGQTLNLHIGYMDAASAALFHRLTAGSGSNTVKLSVGGGNFPQGFAASTVTTPVIQLMGDVKGLGLTVDGTYFDATIANHAAGAMFYNSSATLGGAGVNVRGTTVWAVVAA